MTETWHDLGDVPDGVTVVDADGDMWRHGSAGLEWKPQGRVTWRAWVDQPDLPYSSAYAPYMKVSR